MAEAIPDKPVSKPKRPKAGELLGNLEMRAALEPFIANDPLGKLGYELFRRGIINVDALVFPSEEHGDYLGRSSGVVQGTFQPSGEYRKAAKELFMPGRGVIDKVAGQAEHPWFYNYGKGLFQIDSLVKGDLNAFKANNFEIPIRNLIKNYERNFDSVKPFQKKAIE